MLHDSLGDLLSNAFIRKHSKQQYGLASGEYQILLFLISRS